MTADYPPGSRLKMHVLTPWKYIIWLSLLQVVKGQSTPTVTGGPGQCVTSVSSRFTSTIISPREAAALASPCPAYGGSIVIAPNITEDLTFTGLESIAGDLVIHAILTPVDIYFPSLHTIKSQLWMIGSNGADNAHITYSSNHVAFKSLTWVPHLVIQDWDFTPSKGRSDSMASVLAAGSLAVRNSTLLRNTTLTDITIPSLDQPANHLTVGLHKQLRSVKVKSSFSGPINIHDSGDPARNDPFFIDFTSSASVSSVQIENNTNLYLSDIPALNGDLQIRRNSGMQAVNLTSLSTLKGSLEISSNPDLTQLSFPRLASIQTDLRIVNNSRLLSAGDLPSLKVVSGSVALAGPINDIAYKNQLALVSGAFSLDSTTTFPCGDLYKLLNANKVLQNSTFGCRSVNDTSGQPTSILSNPTDTNPNSKSSGNSNNISIGVIVGITVGAVVACVVVILAGFCCWRRQRQRKTESQAQYINYGSQMSVTEPSSAYTPRSAQELWSDPASELSTDVHKTELPPTPSKPKPMMMKRPFVRNTTYELAG